MSDYIPRRALPAPAPIALAPRFAYRERPQPQKFAPSPQQQAFFDWVLDGSGNALLEAVAGAGKTTTLIQALRIMQGSVFFGAYNKKICEEIKAKAAQGGATRRGTYISTMHGVGYAAWLEINPKVEVDDRKTAKLISAMAEQDPAYLPLTAFISKMVSFGKQFIIGVNSRIDNIGIWTKIMKHFAVDQELPEDATPAQVEEAVGMAIEIFRQSAASCNKRIDFDDMIFAPLMFKARFYRNDWVLIDECQDINPARRELAKRLLKPTGRLIAVGDSRQAIYGFTGAGGDSVERIIEEFNCVRLPLTITYRCPKAVVSYVSRWVSHIEAHPNAPEGKVRAPELAAIMPGQPATAWFMQDAPAISDVILCRYTKPLIQTAFRMIRAGIGCKVEGRDIGHNLIVLATRWKISSINALEKKLAVFLEHEVAKARAEDSERKEQEVMDRVDTLRVFIERCREKKQTSIAQLEAEIKSLFADNVEGVVTLSTIHKAKGREWPRVYWMQAALRAKHLLDWEAVQEENMNYVAGTRAMQELILVPEGTI